MIKDLRHRGEKNVLVTKGQASAIDSDMAAQYSTVERMDPCIEKYCNVYAKDLAERLSLNERNLPDALATPTLLNPMFGSEKRIVGSGLMSEGQYFKARQNLLRKFKTSSTKTIPSFALNYPTTAPAVMMMMMTSLGVIIQIMVRRRKNWRSLSALSGRSISQHLRRQVQDV